MKMMYILSGVVIFSLLTFLGIKVWNNHKAEMEKLPQEFEHYQSIDSNNVITSGYITMKLLLKSTEYIKSYLTPEKQLILFTVPRAKENAFYKLNQSGDIVDSLTLSGRTTDIALVKGVIIDKAKNQYYDWSLKGSKKPVNIIEQNKDFKWDVPAQQKQLDEILKKGKSVYVDNNVNGPEPKKYTGDGIPTVEPQKVYYGLIYFIDDKCFKFYTELDVSEHFSYKYSEQLSLNNVFKYIDTAKRHEAKLIKAKEVYYRYFQKYELQNVLYSGGGGNAPPFYVKLYPGNLFTDVVFKNNTLKLKEFMYMEAERGQSDIDIDGKNIGTLSKNKAQPPMYIDGYGFYTAPGLKYALFSNSDKKIYLIR